GALRLETRSNSVLSQVRFTARGLFTGGADGIGRIWKVTQANARASDGQLQAGRIAQPGRTDQSGGPWG
ncbi:MAG TPA: hypothetical protein VMF65_09620, partial [Acidimicrobiales bacterium]|nr:hypothetical protein [Acidimicrobiales bacterium]